MYFLAAHNLHFVVVMVRILLSKSEENKHEFVRCHGGPKQRERGPNVARGPQVGRRCFLVPVKWPPPVQVGGSLPFLVTGCTRLSSYS